MWIPPTLHIIFKRQIRETYIKMSIKNTSKQTITYFDFTVYLQITFEKQFYIF